MSIADDTPLAGIMKAAVDAMLIIDTQGTVCLASDSLHSLFGYSQQEALGRNVSFLMPEPDRTAHDGYIHNYLTSQNPKIIGIGRKTFGQRKTGEVFPMHLSVGTFEYEGARYFVGICHDLSDYESAVVKLSAAEKRYKNIVESEKHFICRLDSHLRITFANRSLLKVLGLNSRQLRGQTITAIMAGNDLSFTETVQSLFSTPGAEEISIKVALKSRETATLAEWSFRKVLAHDSDAFEIQGLGIDISEKEEAISRAHYLNTHDQLTGVLTPRTMIDQAIQSADKEARYALFHLDADRFGQINQRFGHDMGDQVIMQIASRLRANLPDGAWIARPGGDEFLILCPIEDPNDTVFIGQRFLQAFSTPWVVKHQYHQLDCKMGVALYPFDTENWDRLSELSEAALKDAKQNGESIVLFNRQSHQSLLRKIMIEQALKAALKDNRIEIYLQPKINLETMTLSAFEALARWEHSDIGAISPAEFVPIAEAAGLAVQLDRYILRKVAELASNASQPYAPCPPIAVNITANHFAESDVFDYLADLLNEFKLPPTAIELEITEGVVIDTTRTVSRNFGRLRKLGIRISIDDFGTGYSTLSYLKQLDVDELKIDKSFIDDISQPKGRVIIKSIIDIARTFGLEVTAEGVETEPQARLLADLGCTTGQGYFFSRPLPAVTALKWTAEAPVVTQEAR